MSAINFSGLASGLDTESIIKGLMEAESQPLERLQQTREYEQAKLNAFKAYDDKLSALNSAISGLYLSSGIQQSKVSLSSEDNVTAEVTSASAGTYDVAVEQTARVQKSVSDKAYASRSDDVFGSGELVFTVGEGAEAVEHTVAVEDGKGALSDIMKAINDTSQEHGISASIIDNGNEGGDRYHLMLSGADSSTTFSMTSSLAGGTEQLAIQDPPVQEARNAIAYIDGIQITSDTNTIKNALNGVTLHLESASATDGAGELVPTTMKIETDTASVTEKVEGFVAAYNDIVSYVNGINQGEEAEAGAGMLRGDSLVKTVTRRLQGLVSTRVDDSGNFDSLAQLGLSTNRDGTLSFDSSGLESAMNEDFSQVVDVLAGDSGVFKQYRNYLNDMTSSSDGLYATREDSTESTLKRIDSDIERTSARLERREEMLRQRFAAMEEMVAMFNSQSEYLTQQMDKMPGYGG